MRKTTFLFSFLLMVGMTLFFTACNKDDDDETPDPKYYPTVDFKGGGDYVTGNVTIETGADFHVGIIASMNATSKEKLQGFNITRVINNTPEVIFNEVFNEETYNFDSVFTAVDEAVAANYIFTIIDDDAMETELSFVITTQEPAPQFGEINFYSNVVLGSFGDATVASMQLQRIWFIQLLKLILLPKKLTSHIFMEQQKKLLLVLPTMH